MTEKIEAIPRYPLAWPIGWKRTARHQRRRATFSTSKLANGRLSVAVAVERLSTELDRLGARAVTLSTNVELRLDGRPRSDNEPTDVGAAVYFNFRGKATVFACDCYDRVADNIAAIAAHIDAIRRIERYGVGSLEQALAGYKALPADSAADWRHVFGFGADERVTVDALTDRYHARAREAHPDTGGSDVAMAHVNRAREFALAELAGR